jgi:hypothetical protein
MENKYELAKKAYYIDFDKIEEGYLACSQICYSDNINEAKSYLLDQLKYDNWKLKDSDEEITYINIPVKRYPNADKYVFEDIELTLFEIDKLLFERERINGLDEMLNNKDIQYCYIIKRGLYYGNNWCGYTDYIYKAGIYKKEDAISHAKSCGELSIKPVNIIEHNKMINKNINELKTKLIRDENNNIISEFLNIKSSLLSAFNNTKPLSNDLLKHLEDYFNESTLDKPTLENRL